MHEEILALKYPLDPEISKKQRVDVGDLTLVEKKGGKKERDSDRHRSSTSSSVLLDYYHFEVYLLACQEEANAGYELVGKNGKKIVDNDVSQTGSLTPLLLAKAGYKVLGLTSVTGDTNARDGAYHFAQLFSQGNMSCIPVFEGSSTPLVRTNESLHSWEEVWGNLVWEGAFRADYPTGDEQFPEGIPSEALIRATQRMSAPEFLVEQVKKYPGQVSIVAAGPLTNLAIAQRLYPQFTKDVKELVIMGGMFDTQYNFSSSTEFVADLYSDFNFIFDPEAAQIVLNGAEYPITLVGNSANSLLNSTLENTTNSSIDEALSTHYFAKIFLENKGQTGFPLWDESTAAVLVDGSVSTKNLTVPVTVDTSSSAWSYGFLKLFNPKLLPKSSSRYGNTTAIALSIDVPKFQDMIVDALVADWSSYCDDHDYSS
ncbi:hypothetical protein L7F22_007089 [Adiantum nelumboides]|nr:hypothetical protein [Adiantum nelumboides]